MGDAAKAVGCWDSRAVRVKDDDVGKGDENARAFVSR